MYRYELLNGHYVVTIDGKKFLIDTGMWFSFPFNPSLKEVFIDGVRHDLSSKPTQVDTEDTFELVGTELDGFIGMSILSKTSLTIYKNGYIDFKPTDVQGEKINMLCPSPIIVPGVCDGHHGPFIIDTGAKYGYGVHRLFYGKMPFDLMVEDYNPDEELKHFRSDIYHFVLSLGGITKNVDICYNNVVERKHLQKAHSIIVVSPNSFFEEVCVFDFRRGLLILK